MMGHQTAVDMLRKTAESLVTSEGNLLSNPDEIQETVGKQSQICMHENPILVLKYQPFKLDGEILAYVRIHWKPFIKFKDSHISCVA